MATQPRFYAFRQNNSGGSFHHRPADGIGVTVFVEAMDANHANARAERIGLYFDGCSTGLDCSCCGDRWSQVDEHDASNEPRIYEDLWLEVDAEAGQQPTLVWDIPSYIHRIGGAFVPAIRVED